MFEIKCIKDLPDFVEIEYLNYIIRNIILDDSIFEKYSKTELLDSLAELSERYFNNYHLMSDADRGIISQWLLGHFNIYDSDTIEVVCGIMLSLGLSLIYDKIVKSANLTDCPEFSINIAREISVTYPFGVDNPYSSYPNFTPQKAPPFLR